MGTINTSVNASLVFLALLVPHASWSIGSHPSDPIPSDPIPSDPTPPSLRICIMESNSPDHDQDDAFASKAGLVPHITELREELGSEVGTDLARRIAEYPFGFKSDRGKKGISLTRWKDFHHQAGLRKMAEDFLERDGNGPLFWPDDRASPHYRKLQYSRHRDQIRNSLTMLFWKLNVQYYKNPREEVTPNPRPRGVAQHDVATQHQGQSHESSVGSEQVPPSGAVFMPIVPETNGSAEIPSPVATPRPASPLFHEYIEEPVGDIHIQDTRGESHTSGKELPGQPVVPMASMTDGLDDETSRPNESATAEQGQRKGKGPASHFDLGQDTRPVKRRRQGHNNTVKFLENTAGDFAHNLRTDSMAGSSHSPSRSRRPPTRYDDNFYVGEKALQMMDSPASSSTDDGCDCANIKNTKEEMQTLSRLPTPLPAPRQTTLETVGSAAGDTPFEDLKPSGLPRDWRLSASPAPLTLGDDPIVQNMFMPEHGVEPVQVPVPDCAQGSDPGFNSNRLPKMDPTREGARGNVPGSALGGEFNHDHKANLLPPVNLIYVMQFSRSDFASFFPRSAFSELSLQELMDNLPHRGDFSRFAACLETGGKRYHHKDNIGEETSFQRMKTWFQETIQETQVKSRGESFLRVKITIVPIG
ncbi:hypothetical protein B0J13DRAFT_545650 [Dactylonectria estremocensis]|uniref:Uncharacterized protein n=1 Tax=Dactylonectria estremocensis TaxID=1079267 RepID=A0A9P9F4P6_9HYPO|nr:hypothetical protein B0J13DRAFT_545650 [Dactylonectria estremocensis]